MKETIIFTSVGITFTGQHRAEGAELSARTLSDYLSGLTGKYEFDSIVERGDQVILYLGERQGLVEFNCNPGELSGHAPTSLMGPGFHQTVSLMGPGFHQTVVELLEDMAKVFSLDLNIDDPAGYRKNKDFDNLQQYYIGWLASQFETMAEYGGQHYFDWERSAEFTAHGNSLPVRTEFLITPMGAFTAEAVRNIISQSAWLELAQNYFLWFHSGKEAYYYRNAALFDLWNSRWTEKARFILARFKQARQRNPGIPIPLREVKALAELAGETADFGGPDMPLFTPAGYCHDLIRYLLPQGWSASIPGEFTMEAEYDDEENIIYPITFYCGEKYIRFLYAFTDDGTEVFEPKQIWRTQWDHKYLCLDSFTYKAGAGHGQQWNCRVQASGHSLAVELEGIAGAWIAWVMNVFESIVYIGKEDSEGGTFG